MANESVDRLRQLPIQVPLQPGESTLSFVRRLATANHLRTSYLRGCLARIPGGHTAAIDITRLSLVTGRTESALQHVFPDLKRTPASPAAPATRGQRGMNVDLADRIRAAAADDHVVNALSVHFGVPRSTIIKALLGTRPYRDDDPLQSNPKLRAVSHHIDSRLTATPAVTVKEIWNELKAQHGLAVSYGTVRSYVNRARAQDDDPRAAQHILTRAAFYDLIRYRARGHDLIAALMTRFSADRDTVIGAVASKAPWPDKPTWAPIAPGRRRNRILSAHETYIDEMLSANPDLRIYEIRDHLLDEHQVDVSYGTVRDYIARRQRWRRGPGGDLRRCWANDGIRNGPSPSAYRRSEKSRCPPMIGSMGIV